MQRVSQTRTLTPPNEGGGGQNVSQGKGEKVLLLLF